MQHLPAVRVPGRLSSAQREGTEALLSSEEGLPARLECGDPRRTVPAVGGSSGNGGGGPARASVDASSAGPVEHFALEAESRREQWEAMADLDTFFARVYGYYRERGLRCILLSRVTSVLMLLFTLLASYCAAELVNWHDLLYACRDERSCLQVELILPLRGRPSLFMSCYLLLFSVYLCWQLLHLAVELRLLLEIGTFYHTRLGLSDAQLQQVGWDEVVRRLVCYQAASKFVIVKESLSAHDVAMRVLRQENWLVALIDNDVLPLDTYLPLVGTRPLLPQTLEWALYTSLLNSMYDGQLRIRKAFLNDPAALRRRFVLAGLLNLALLPFVALFMAVFFFLRHAEEIHRQPGSIGARAYSRHALWRMREYNELQHVFDERIRASYEDATKYVNSFPSRELAIVARLVTFVFGSLAAAAIAISVLNQEVLIHYRAPQAAGGHNLLWYLALASGALAVSRSFSAEPQEGLPEQWLQRVAANTHLLPPEWEGRAHERSTYRAFCAMFEYKVGAFIVEIISCVTTPYALCCTLPRAAERIVAFVQQATVHIDGIGDVCACATFALPPSAGGADGQGGGVGAGVSSEAAAANRGLNKGLKLQKSLLSFAAHHPQWHSAAGDALLSTLVAQHNLAGTGGGGCGLAHGLAVGSAGSGHAHGAHGSGPAGGLAHSNLLLAALDRQQAHGQAQAQPPFHPAFAFPAGAACARSGYAPLAAGYSAAHCAAGHYLAPPAHFGGGAQCYGSAYGGYGCASSFIGQPQPHAQPFAHPLAGPAEGGSGGGGALALALPAGAARLSSGSGALYAGGMRSASLGAVSEQRADTAAEHGAGADAAAAAAAADAEVRSEQQPPPPPPQREGAGSPTPPPHGAADGGAAGTGGACAGCVAHYGASPPSPLPPFSPYAGCSPAFLAAAGCGSGHVPPGAAGGALDASAAELRQLAALGEGAAGSSGAASRRGLLLTQLFNAHLQAAPHLGAQPPPPICLPLPPGAGGGTAPPAPPPLGAPAPPAPPPPSSSEY